MLHLSPHFHYDSRVQPVPAGPPKYRQIYDSLKQAMAIGEYRAGQRLPTESELVKSFNTSRVTVNRALRELQLAGFINRKVGSGSYVSATAAQDYTFGLLIPDLGRTEIFEPICRGMAEARVGQEQVLLWGRSPGPSQDVETQARELCEQWIAKKVSGVFFAPLELTSDRDRINERIAELFIASNIPVVLLDRDVVPYPERSSYDLIGIDNRRAGYVATSHLVGAGCKRLIFVGRHRSAPSCVARGVGFRDALYDAGIECRADFVQHQTDPSSEEQVRRIMSDLRPDGIVCSNDFTAAQLMKTLEQLSISVPDDVKMVGFDDVKYASLLSVPLTTIHQPCADIGATAIRTMIDRLRDPKLPARDILLNFGLVVRESSSASRSRLRKTERSTVADA
jgi:GntR family transcriptional regulator, arabinose operon transcriptional repressor